MPQKKVVKSAKSLMSATLKAEVEKKAAALVEQVLKPEHVKPPQGAERFNYITDIVTRWHAGAFYFCSIYACPRPNGDSVRDETNFARMEFTGNSRFTLSFMRHTGVWVRLYTEQTVEECMKSIQGDPWFVP